MCIPQQPPRMGGAILLCRNAAISVALSKIHFIWDFEYTHNGITHKIMKSKKFHFITTSRKRRSSNHLKRVMPKSTCNSQPRLVYINWTWDQRERVDALCGAPPLHQDQVLCSWRSVKCVDPYTLISSPFLYHIYSVYTSIVNLYQCKWFINSMNVLIYCIRPIIIKRHQKAIKCPLLQFSYKCIHISQVHQCQICVKCSTKLRSVLLSTPQMLLSQCVTHRMCF